MNQDDVINSSVHLHPVGLGLERGNGKQRDRIQLQVRRPIAIKNGEQQSCGLSGSDVLKAP